MTDNEIMKGILLVGGPCDGEKHMVRRDQTMLFMREKPKISLNMPPPDPKAEIKIRTCRYQQGNDSQIYEFTGWDDQEEDNKRKWNDAIRAHHDADRAYQAEVWLDNVHDAIFGKGED